MSTNEPPLAPEVHQPDQFWEYLDSAATYTINLRNELSNTCLMAVNTNIIRFQPNPSALSSHIEAALAVVKEIDETLPMIKQQHQGKTGYALHDSTIADFLSVHEQYIVLQSKLLDAMQRHGAAILTMSDSAHANAVAAGAVSKLNDPVQVDPTKK
ncbi:hypothetical protein Ea357_264 [Erwinia phage Ea35-70]|uniref:Uncharacterized protein n=2 Tax=Agricanvirus TaxID=1984776 RepID=W6ARL7_9CAUD|nr:hypothetical protein Ea357_264 [Erwinia phage Ea35-70]YP_009622011.1 hypothetical protein FDJ23_gp270 [Erwinia phage vB_EamM_Desertfox]AHI60418.1 hypothetical protein Ea357_264 [Erwinia phage Ea35-70]AUG86377.1 hypothetical protein DESERTFOX_270 [Erwinia phage vB_EamM_Desertfox]